MHAPVAVVDMTNLAPAGEIDRFSGKQGKALLLKTGRADPEGLWVPDGEILQTRAKYLIHLSTPWLIQLSLGCNACYLWSWSSPLREPSMSSLVVSGWWIYLFREGCWRVWIGKGEEAEVSDFEIA